MSLDHLLDSVPSYAKDLKLNFSTLVRQPNELTPQQLWGTLVSTAIASRNPELIEAVLAEAAANLSPEAFEAAKAAAAVMGMNNIYYRFLHLSTNQNYRNMPARLRMNAIRSHGVEQVDFELWCTAVSAVNGCGACIESHEKTIREKGMSEEAIATAVRIASVVHGLAVVLDSEKIASAHAVGQLH